MVLFTDLPLALLKTLILQGQIVNLVVDLHGEVFHSLQYLRVCLFQQGDVVTLMRAENDAFRTNGQGVAFKAEVLNLLFGVVTTCIPRLPQRLVVDIK